MISAWLSVEFAKNGVAFSELNLAILLEMVELPLDELIVIRVASGCDERPAPVSHESEPLKGLHTKGREKA